MVQRLTNFGVELFLRKFVDLAPPPGPRETSTAEIDPEDDMFSAFIFKIQANMDPRHRDRVAFMRICSGSFTRDMEVWHPRLKRKIRLASPLRLFGQDREVIEEAVAGDVVGVINPGQFTIGDTVAEKDIGLFPPLPRFQPEHFALLRGNTDRSRTSSSSKVSRRSKKRARFSSSTRSQAVGVSRFWQRSARCSSMSCGIGSRRNTTLKLISNR